MLFVVMERRERLSAEDTDDHAEEIGLFLIKLDEIDPLALYVIDRSTNIVPLPKSY